MFWLWVLYGLTPKYPLPLEIRDLHHVTGPTGVPAKWHLNASKC